MLSLSPSPTSPASPQRGKPALPQHWYRSSADNARLKLFSFGGIALFTAALSIALVAAFPFQDLAAKLAKGGKADLLTVAYLRAWLRAEPDKLELNATLARQLQMIGSYEEAYASLKPLLASTDPQLRIAAQRLEIDILRSHAWSLEEGSVQRAELLAEAARKLRILVPPPVAAATAGAAASASAAPVQAPLSPEQWQQQLIATSNAPPPDADYSWFTQQARHLLGLGLYRLSAEMNWRAMAVAETPAKRRQAFDTALATLEGGNLAALALEQLEPRLKLLQPDATLYKRLVRLAMAAGRLDLAERYAKVMLRLSLLQQWQHWESAQAPLLAALADVQARTIALEGSKPAPKPGSEAAGASEAAGPALPFDDESYRLGFDVFMARGNLADALRVVKSAVKQAPGNLEWLKRLAQLNEWTGKPVEALEAWFSMVQRQSSADNWGQVKRLANMLLDFDKQLAVLQWEYSQKPEQSTLFAIAHLLEEMGRPREAFAVLSNAVTTAPENQELLDRLLTLADRLRDGPLLQRWLAHGMKAFPARIDYALREAIHLNEAGKADQALTLLMARRELARKESDQNKLIVEEAYFWSVLAELARSLQRDEIAVDALLTMLRNDRLPEIEVPGLISLVEEDNPEFGIAIARFAFAKYGNPRFAKTAASLLIRIADVDRLALFLAGLPATVRTEMEADAAFLSLRANLYLSVGRNDAARRDIDMALTLAPDNIDLKAQAIWLLIGSRDSRALIAALQRWDGESRKHASLWGPFGAAWMALQEPQRARPYFIRQSRLKPDFLWNLTLADCLDQTGLPDAAWGLRRQAWLEMHKPTAAKSSAELRQLTAVLAMQFAVGEQTKRLLNSLVREIPSSRRARQLPLTSSAASGAVLASQAATGAAQPNSDALVEKLTRTDLTPAQAEALLRDVWLMPRASAETSEVQSTNAIDSASVKELALSYFLSTEQTDLAKAWLISNYASTLQRPGWAELNIALAQKDEATLIRLLDTVADWLPKLDRVEALQQTGQFASAQTLAFQLAEQRPDSTEANTRLAQLLDDKSSKVRLSWASGNQSSVEFSGPRLESNWRISPSLSLDANFGSSTLRNSDSNFPSSLSTRETDAELGLRWLRDTGKIGLSVLTRSSVTESTGLRLDWRENFDSKYNIQTMLQWRAPTSDTQGLRVYGYSDQLRTSGRFDFSKREYVSAQVTLSQFGLEGYGAVARGVAMNAEAGHKLRLEYPDMTARVNLAVGRYRENARFQTAASALVPGFSANSKSIFIPGDSTTVSAQLGFGSSARDRNHGGGISPFGEIAVSYDSLVGNGYNASLGFSTSVFGGDRLFLGGSFISATPSNPRPSREISAGYRLQF